MKLTYKAIARAAGYRIKEEYREPIGNIYPRDFELHCKWHDLESGEYACKWFRSEDEAWKDCCIYNNLVSPEPN